MKSKNDRGKTSRVAPEVSRCEHKMRSTKCESHQEKLPKGRILIPLISVKYYHADHCRAKVASTGFLLS